jgi:hypothetical protein
MATTTAAVTGTVGGLGGTASTAEYSLYVTQAAAEVTIIQGLEPIAVTGAPGYPWNLFLGQVIGVAVTRVGPLLKARLRLSDLNRLWDLIAVGAPQFGNQLRLPDPPPLGTVVDIDPNALNYGIGAGDGGVVKYKVDAYWPVSPYPGVPDVTDVVDTNPEYSGGDPVIDWTTALSTLAAWNAAFDARQGPFTRTWIDPDNKIQHRKVGQDGGSDQRVPAPYGFSSDGPWTATTVMPMSMDIDWDLSNVRRRVFVRGGTPVSSRWFPGAVAPPQSGEAYIDAPGALTYEEAQIIASWHARWTYVPRMSGSIAVQPGLDGWRVGQVVPLTDPVLSRYQELDAYEAIVQSVKGTLVSPGASDLGIEIDGVDWSEFVSDWSSLTFGETGFGQPDSADLTIEIFDESGDLTIADNASVRIFKNGPLAEIQYQLTVGDAPVGSLASQTDNTSTVPVPFYQGSPRAVYRFAIMITDRAAPLVDGLIAELTAQGTSVVVSAQLTDIAGVPVFLAGVIAEWFIIVWANDAGTIPGTGITLETFTGETDTNGRIYNTILQSGVFNAVSYQVDCRYLPFD